MKARIEAISEAIGDRGEWFARVLSSVEDAVTVQDAATGSLVYANAAAAKALDCASPEEVVSTPPGELFARFEVRDEEGNPLEVERLPGRRAAAGESPPPLVLRHRNRRTGEERWTETRASPVLDTAGRVAFVVNVVRDVSDRRRFLEELERERAASLQSAALTRQLQDLTAALSEALTPSQVLAVALERAMAVSDASRGGMLIPDHETGLLDVVEARGYEPAVRERFRAIPMDSGFTPAAAFRERKPVWVPDEEAYRRTFPQHAALATSLGHGAAAALPLAIAEDQLVGVLFLAFTEPRAFDADERAFLLSIARQSAVAYERARLYDAERGARERLGVLALANARLATSLDYNITLASVASTAVPVLADWCAVDIVEPGGNLRRHAVSHVDVAKVELAYELQARFPTRLDDESAVAIAIRTNEPVHMPRVTGEMIRATGRPPEYVRIVAGLGLESAIVVPMTVHGQVLGAITLANAESGRIFGPGDVSLARDLAHNAALAVENARLYREAREANRLKDEFLANLSHELRTPLNAMLGWARMLEIGNFDEAGRKRAVDAINRNAAAQVRLVEELLEVSRITAGKIRLDVRECDPREVVRSAVDTVRLQAEAARLTITTRFERRPCSVQADPDRIRQVVSNLLSNAVKFTPPDGRITVDVRVYGDRLRIQVADTGRGIDPDFAPFVFDRFRQAEESIRRTQGGLGLGLSITRDLVELHGGSVWVESRGLGLGSTFHVELPMRAPDAAATAAPAAKSTPKMLPKKSARKPAGKPAKKPAKGSSGKNARSGAPTRTARAKPRSRRSSGTRSGRRR